MTDPAVFFGETSTTRVRRTILELTEWLTRDNPVLAGTVLLTWTGLVPDGLSFAGGRTVEIRVEGIGTLSKPVARR
jgi:2-dehydro-3-deoxy-D-arabinonate dehydratase